MPAGTREPVSSRALGKHQSQSPGALRAPRTASPATWPRGRHGKAGLTRGVLRFWGGEATTPQCPESRRYYNEDPGAGGEGPGVAGGRCVRYFSPALLPNGAGSCGTVTLCPPGGRREEGLSLGGPPVLPSWWGPSLLQAQRTPCSWQMRVEVDTAAACVHWPLVAERSVPVPVRRPGPDGLFPTAVPVSGGPAQSLFPRRPGRPVAVVPGQAPGRGSWHC